MIEFTFTQKIIVVRATDLQKAIKEFHKATGNAHIGMKHIDVSHRAVVEKNAQKQHSRRFPWLPSWYKGV